MIFYDIAFIIFSVFYISFSIYKKGFRGFNLKMRMGFIPAELKKELRGNKNIWIHAVSVGEVMVLMQFLQRLKENFPDHHIVISTTTKAGNTVAKKIAGRDISVMYSPLDLSFAVKKFINIIAPKIFIIVETEIWPNIIKIMKKRKIPVVIINGRISTRAFKRYNVGKLFLRPVLKNIDLFCMQNQVYASRIISIGAPNDKVKITGNMKFDAVSDGMDQIKNTRELLGLGQKDILIVAGSTHNGEEEILINAYKSLKKDFYNLQLLIAPRHIERAPKIKSLIKAKGFVPLRISKIFNQGMESKPEDKIFLLDEVGFLKSFYSAADIVFVGGSLIPHGGQNPIEPAYFSKPIIFGPFMFNFEDMSAALLNEGAAIEAKDENELKRALVSLIGDPKKCHAMGFFAKKAIEKNKGASEKNMESIKVLMKG